MLDSDPDSTAARLAALEQQVAAASARRLAASRKANAVKIARRQGRHEAAASLALSLGWADPHRRLSDRAVIRLVRERLRNAAGRAPARSSIMSWLVRAMGPSAKQKAASTVRNRPTRPQQLGA